MSTIEPSASQPTPSGAWPPPPPLPGAYPEPQEKIALLGPRSAVDFTPGVIGLIVLAAFLTSFGQTSQIGQIPIQFLILKKMHYKADTLASFAFLSAFAWYFKPIVGLVLDSVPFLGTRRRSYMIAASGLSVFGWLGVGYASGSYPALLWTAIGLNVFMMIASTAMGALLVECGQRKAATGGLSSMRETVSMVGQVLLGVCGGFLASKAFPYTGYTGAALMLILFLGAVMLLKERPTATADRAVWHVAGEQLRVLAGSKPLLMSALMMLLVFLAPGFGAILQARQIDTLHLSAPQVGLIGTLQGVTGIIGALLYGVLCRFVNLRLLLAVGIVLNVASTLIYFGYNSYHAALFIDPTNQLMVELAVLPIYDLAARATPKGGEGMGFSVMMAVRNLALFGSQLATAKVAVAYHLPFHTMLIANAAFTACVLVMVPLIPSVLVRHRDGTLHIPPDATTAERATTFG